jgi:SAM-dependent methyltransferase
VGLDFHALNFLKYVHKFGDFGETVTIGRQELHVNEAVFGSVIGTAHMDLREAYCERLLERRFGSSKVESIDNSSFESATHIHDMNNPIPADLRQRYDTVIDAGTLEHIYDIVQGLKTCSALCRPGGQIIHVLPANNFCGHGFWQFSPELFFSLYSRKNGYANTEVFIADFTNKRQWFKVVEPTDGKRVTVNSSAELYVMVRTVVTGDTVSHADVQQSDYAYEWDNVQHDPEVRAPSTGLKGALMRSPILYDTLFPLYHKLMRARSPDRVSGRNPGLQAMDLERLVA